MDQLEKALTHTVTRNGKTYTFRRPTVKQMILSDVLAAQMRGGMPINSLTHSLGNTEMVALLNTAVTEPKGFDFSELYEDDLGAIYDEVAKWLETFRQNVGAPQARVGSGDGE